MKGLITLLLIITLSSCTKSSDTKPETVNITYEVESTSPAAFGQLTIGVPYYGQQSGTSAYEWKITGAGTFDTTIQFRKGVVSTQMFALHPTSDKWKIRIKNDGKVVSEGLPTFYQLGAYSYYSSTIQATP
jgi:hypothetical protein